jgi:hypothetical protein
MKCSCGEPATVHVTEALKRRVRHFCEACARRAGLVVPEPRHLCREMLEGLENLRFAIDVLRRHLRAELGEA